MKAFRYHGVTFIGDAVSGRVRGENPSAVEETLRANGILLSEVAGSSTRIEWSFGRKHDAAVTRYFRHLSALVGAGVPLSRALDGQAERASGASWKQILTSVADRVRRGSTFARALEDSGIVFSGVAIPMIAAGESGGNLSEVLERIATFREKSEAVNRKVRGALIYPIVVSTVAIVVVWIMLAYVVPIFSQMFTNLGAELPKPTQLLLAGSELARSWWWIIPLIGLAGIAAYRTIRLNPIWRLRIARCGLSLPVAGEILAKTSVARFSRTAGTLLENGVPLLPAIRTSAKTSGNVAIERVFLDAADAVERGRPLSECLSNVKELPALASQILSTGEETANLGRMFNKLADFYEAETDASVGVITSIIEPVLVVIMGIIVAGILIALYLPMFDVLSQIGG